MKTNIINIGNSQGVILPAAILRRLGLHTKSSVEIELSEDGIFIKPSPRQGWAEAAIAMHAAGDDALLLDDAENHFDREEWTW
jgi:antitoxin MazE